MKILALLLFSAIVAAPLESLPIIDVHMHALLVTTTWREEQRVMTKLEAARTVQPLLLPRAQLNTPNFAVESIDLPAYGEPAQATAKTARKFGKEDDLIVLTVARVANLRAVLV